MFLCTNNKLSGREIKKTIALIIASKRIKYSGINLTKVKNLYSENYKTLIKEIKEDTNKWKDIPCSCIGRINIGKICILHNAIYRLSEIPIKIPMALFHRKKKILKPVWSHKRPQVDKAILRKKNKAGGIILPDFKLYCKAIVIETTWNWPKKRDIEQQNK